MPKLINTLLVGFVLFTSGLTTSCGGDGAPEKTAQNKTAKKAWDSLPKWKRTK